MGTVDLLLTAPFVAMGTYIMLRGEVPRYVRHDWYSKTPITRGEHPAAFWFYVAEAYLLAAAVIVSRLFLAH